MSPVEKPKNLSPFEKETDVHDRVLSFIKNQPDGMTTTDIQKNTKISRKTLEKHLSLLVSKNEIHMNQFGPTRVYYPNKKVENFKSEKIIISNRTYYFDLLQNQYGRFYLLQEKKKENGKLISKGSLLVPEANIQEFVSGLNKLL